MFISFGRRTLFPFTRSSAVPDNFKPTFKNISQFYMILAKSDEKKIVLVLVFKNPSWNPQDMSVSTNVLNLGKLQIRDIVYI